LARLSITILTAEYNCEIQKINEHVIVLEEGLMARGETLQDTMMNVQAAYMVCKDADFVRHAKDEYARWEQGANMSLKEYMSSCLIKYKTLRMKGVGEAPSPEQEQIMALTAAVSSLKCKAKSGKTKPTSKESSKQTDKGPRKNDGNFAWKDMPPKAGESTTKVINGKTYFWCTHHTNPMWALHNLTAFPDLCRLHPKYTEMEAAHKAKKRGAAAGKEPTVAGIQLSQAMAAINDSGSEASVDESVIV
jgi:glucan-binding YG repeat protein